MNKFEHTVLSDVAAEQKMYREDQNRVPILLVPCIFAILIGRVVIDTFGLRGTSVALIIMVAVLGLIFAWFLFDINRQSEYQPLNTLQNRLLQKICERRSEVDVVIQSAILEGKTLRVRDFNAAEDFDLRCQFQENPGIDRGLNELAPAIGADRRGRK